jgi:hypothetical protein
LRAEGAGEVAAVADLEVNFFKAAAGEIQRWIS